MRRNSDGFRSEKSGETGRVIARRRGEIMRVGKEVAEIEREDVRALIEGEGRDALTGVRGVGEGCCEEKRKALDGRGVWLRNREERGR